MEPGIEKRPFFRKIFLSADEPRLRAGWRLLVQTLLLLVLSACLAIPLGISILVMKLSIDSPWVMLLSQLVELGAIGASVFLARHFLDRRSITSLGTGLNRWTALDLGIGFGIALVMMATVFLLQLALDWITFEGFAWQSDSIVDVLVNVVLFFVIFVLVGWNEELLSRGYHLQTLASGLNLAWGVMLSSAIFGILHIFNPGANWVSSLGIFFAGLFLALGYLRTRQLWLPIGLHLGWNFCEGVLFGFPVSGLDIYPLIRITVTGPELWTGGRFGPEAGLIMLPALALGSLLIFVYTLSRQNQASDQS